MNKVDLRKEMDKMCGFEERRAGSLSSTGKKKEKK